MPEISSQTPSDTSSLLASSLGATALDTLREEMLAIPPRDLVTVNVDVAAAALTVLAASRQIREHRAELVALVGEEMASVVDRLDPVARAALQAHNSLQAVLSGEDIQTLSAELVQIREALVAEVRALIARHVLATGVLRELRGAHGFQNQCSDVLRLVSLLERQWDVVGPNTGVDLAYLRHAERVTHALVSALGARSRATRSPNADLRQRAYTLMFRTYDRARRIVSFLRWDHGDADVIAPRLMSGRGRGRRRQQTTDTDVITEPMAPLAPSTEEPDVDHPGANPLPLT